MNTIAEKNSQDAHVSTGATPAPADKALMPVPSGTSAGHPLDRVAADPPSHPDAPATPTDGSLRITQPQTPITTPPMHRYRKWLLLAGTMAALAAGGYVLVPWIHTAVSTVSTDDAYVNGHVTLVAPRVSGQVMKVLVDDNQRVKTGDLLVQLDKEPFQVLVSLKRAAVRVAEANLAAAESAARGLEAQLGTQRWKLQNASEQVDAQVALLRSQVAALRSQEAILDKARADFKRAAALLPTHAVSQSDYDQFEQQLRVAAASVAQAHEAIAQTRVSLGLAPQPQTGKGLSDVPPDLNQTFSSVRAALAQCMLTMTQLGRPMSSTDLTPNKAIEEFGKLDKKDRL
jgi:membrane fusion protein (multidrug efflux system)